MKANVTGAARPRRVLFLARLFGGLKAGVAAGRWEPRGVPAIYQLIEGLARDPDVDLFTVFSAKEEDARYTRCLRQKIEPIGETLTLPRRRWLGSILRPVNTLLTELEQTWRILALAARFRPDVIYATYASILPAGLLARLGSSRVILRLLGVVPHHREILAGRRPLFRWLLRSPFDHVVSTEDGSDPAALLPGLLREGVPWSVRLNGCDARPMSDRDRRAFLAGAGLGDRPVIVFLGRLEAQKGSLAFIDAALILLERMPDGADIVIVGDGPLRRDMEARVAAAGQEDRIRFTGLLPHRDAYRHVAAADIYVSVNLYGNLSNANLEALAAGVCLVLPTSDPTVPLDTATDSLIPAHVALRYDRNRRPDSLAEALAKLLKSPQEIADRRARSRDLARKVIKPWSKCIAQDIAALKSPGPPVGSPAVRSAAS